GGIILISRRPPLLASLSGWPPFFNTPSLFRDPLGEPTAGGSAPADTFPFLLLTTCFLALPFPILIKDSAAIASATSSVRTPADRAAKSADAKLTRSAILPIGTRVAK